jgi:hypothetical protein
VCRQDTLELSTQIEIVDEFKKIDDLSEALNLLRIIINYALATVPNKDEQIVDFLRKIYTEISLKQAESILKTKIIETGKLKYLKHIWLLLSMKKAVLFSLNNQDPFEALNENFKNTIEQENLHKISLINYDYPVKITLLVVLYQIVIFMMAPLEGEDLQTYPQNSIVDIFDSFDMISPLVMVSNRNKIPDGFPDRSILMRHIYTLWRELCHSLSDLDN